MVAPLAGIKVVEVANWLAAPSCAALMRDMGADVIKVEPPGGDTWRHTAERDGRDALPAPTTYPFEMDNRGKRSITVDLTKPGGPELVRRMVDDADVFITNLIQPRREQYGQSSERLATEIGQLEMLIGDLEESQAQGQAAACPRICRARPCCMSRCWPAAAAALTLPA